MRSLLLLSLLISASASQKDVTTVGGAGTAATSRRTAKVLPRHCGGTVRHVHLAVGHDPATEMIVSFASIPSLYPAPFGGVLIGESATEMDTVYLEEETAASFNQTVGTSVGNYGEIYYSPHYHHVTISGLKPNTEYFYRPMVHTHLGSFKKYNLRHSSQSDAVAAPPMFMTESEMIKALEDSDAYQAEENGIFEDDQLVRHRGLEKLFPYDGSKKECPSPEKIRTFRTAPATAPDVVEPVSFAIIGDLGQYPHSEATLTRLIRTRKHVDAIVLAGDIAYSRLDHRQWDTFFDFLDDFPIVEEKPMQIVPGNHDIDKLQGRREIFLDYEHRFRMPRVKPPQLGLYEGSDDVLNMDQPPYPLPYEWGNAYYSYSYGPARFVMISAYSNVNEGSTQYNWIVEELSSVDRRATPWLIVVLHTPLYNTFSLHRKDPQIFAAKEHLEQLFVEYNVNMVFTGHIHAYLRTKNVSMGKLSPTGPIHITVGAGGRKCEAPFFDPVPEEWVEVRDATMYGYGMFRILNRTHAQWDWVHTGQADDHSLNQVYQSNETLPSGPAVDRVSIENQFYRR